MFWSRIKHYHKHQTLWIRTVYQHRTPFFRGTPKTLQGDQFLQQYPHQDYSLLHPCKKHTRIGTRGGSRGGSRGSRNRQPPTSQTHKNKYEPQGPTNEQTSTIKIFHLSTHPLPNLEYRLLSKGLSLCPTGKIDDFQLFIELNAYIRRLTLTRYFAISELNNPKALQSDPPFNPPLTESNSTIPPPPPPPPLPILSLTTNQLTVV